jgi:hypothetical protein
VNIQDPVAKVGATVLVLNYRKRPAEWERGRILRFECRPSDDLATGHWSYTVRLERMTTRGHPIDLYVSDEDIRAVTA